MQKLKLIMIGLLLLFASNLVSAQQTLGSIESNSGTKFVAVVSPDRDTLYMSIDPTSILIEKVWTTEYADEMPVIVYKSTEEIIVMSNLPRYMRKP